MADLPINKLDGSGLEAKIFVGDLDTALVLRIFDLSANVFNPLEDLNPPALDLSTATPLVDLLMIFVKPPDVPGGTPVRTVVGASFTTAAGLPFFTGTGSDGYIEFRTPSGFLDRPGIWRREGSVALTPGMWSTEIVDFPVFSTL